MKLPLLVIPTPSKPGEPSEAARLRKWLKIGKRSFGIAVKWLPNAPPAAGNGPPGDLDEKTDPEAQ